MLVRPPVSLQVIYGDLLTAGMRQIVDYLPEALNDIENTQRTHDRPVLSILIIVGWAGNDVYGEGGYRGVRWIHRSEHNRSQKPTGRRSRPTGAKSRRHVSSNPAMISAT